MPRIIESKAPMSRSGDSSLMSKPGSEGGNIFKIMRNLKD